MKESSEEEGSIDVILILNSGCIKILFAELLYEKKCSISNIGEYKKVSSQQLWINQKIVNIMQINSLNKGWTTVIEFGNNIVMAILSFFDDQMDRFEDVIFYKNRTYLMDENFVNPKIYNINFKKWTD